MNVRCQRRFSKIIINNINKLVECELFNHRDCRGRKEIAAGSPGKPPGVTQLLDGAGGGGELGMGVVWHLADVASA